MAQVLIRQLDERVVAILREQARSRWVSLELEWVLRGAYRLERGTVISALEGLMAIRQVHLEQEDLVRQALAWHQQGLDFADALHLLRSEGCASFATFDRGLQNTATHLALQPQVQLV